MTSQSVGEDPRVLRNRRRALDAAVAVLTDAGCDALTQANVAARSGVSRATVYRLWPERQQLVLDAVSRVVDLAHTSPTGDDLRQDLAKEILSLARQLDGPLRLVAASLIEQAQHDAGMRAALADLQRSGTSVIRRVLRQASRAGRLTTGADVELAAGIAVGWVVHRTLILGRSPTARAARAVAATLVRS